MSLTKKVFFNTGAQIVSRGLMSLLGIITFALLTRYLGVAGFGDYTTVLAFSGLALTIADFGFSTIILRDLSLQPEAKKRRYFRISNTTRSLFALVVSLATLAILPFLDYSLAVKLGIALVTSSIIVQVQAFAIRNYLQAKYEVYKFVISELIARVVLLGAMFYVLVNGYGLVAIFAATVFTTLLQFFLSLLWIKKTGDYGFQYDAKENRQIIEDSFWMGIVLILSFTYVKVDTVILSFLRDSFDVGIYGAPYRIIEVVSTFPGMLMANLAPAVSQLAKNNLSKLASVTPKILTAMSAISIPLFVGGSLLAPQIITLAAGSEFTNASTVSIAGKAIAAPEVLQILLLVSILSFWVVALNSVVVALGKQKRLLTSYAGAAIFNIAANLIFVPKFSYFAASLTTLIAEFIILVYSAKILKEYIDFRLDFLGLGKVLLSSALMAIAILLLKPIGVILTTLIAALIYLFLALFVFKILNLKKIIR